jgi:hypothetical protein
MRLLIPTAFLLSAAGAGSALALALDAPKAEPAPPPAATPVAPLTVSPEVQAEAKVVASSEAVPLAAPDFTAKDAQDAPLAVRIGPNAAFGRQTLHNEAPPGLLKNNPDLGGTPEQVDVGVTVLF